MTDILVYTEEQGNVIAGSVQPDRMTVAVLGAVGGGTGGSGAVSSVNGQIGHVVLDAADVGADPAGTGALAALAAVAAHVAEADPHTQYTTASEAAAAAPVQSVNTQTGAVVLDAADVGADAAGTAASAVAAHEADQTPHAVITQVDKFGFDTAAAQTAGVGEMVWNATDGTADLGLPGGVTLQVGQEGLIRVLNKTGSTIQNMHVVYITGAQGNRVTAAQAQANNVSADKTLAVATQDIANNAEGFATILGLVRGINTSAWAEGTELWLSAAVAGAITNVRPAAPNHQVRVGYVVRSHASEGSIYVTVNIGADLSHLHDVVITAPNDNDVLAYDAATQTWRNEPQTGGSGEVNTASNLGTGAGVFASKVGADLQFKSLVAGTGVTLTPTATEITITTSGAGGAVDSVNGQTGAVVLDTDDISEGVSNLYFTNARASAAAPVQSVNGQTGAVDLSGSYAPLSHVGAGGTAHAAVVAGGAAGFMTGADKTKLDGIAPGAQVNVPTNLTTTTSATTLTVNSDTGTDATLPAATTSVAGVMTAADKTKLDGIAAGAQVNVPTDLSLGTITNTTIPLNSSTGTDVTLPAATPSTAGLLSGTDKTKLDSVQTGAVAPAQVVEYAGTAKTLALADINTIIDCTSSSAVTITIPPQSSVTWTADAEIHVRMSGTGTVSIAVGSGVTIPPLAAPVLLAGQGAMVTLKRRSADVWAIVGVTQGNQTIFGNLDFSGNSRRLSALMDGSANGFAAQNNVANASTIYDVIPNGTSTTAQLRVHNKADRTGQQFILAASSTGLGIFSGGSSPLPLALSIGIAASWNVDNASPYAFRPGADNTQPLGTASFRASVIYAGTGTINTSDAREKTPVRGLTAAEIEASKQLAKEIGAYRFLSAVAEKGDAAREHIGMTVQRAIEVMEAHGLDPFGYGFICFDSWQETPELTEEKVLGVVTDADDIALAYNVPDPGEELPDGAVWTETSRETVVVRPYRAAGDRYSFRPDELMLFIARGLDARLSALEGQP